MSEQVVHWLPLRGPDDAQAKPPHAVDLTGFAFTTDPALVTCPTCRGHLPTDDGDAGVVQG